MRPVILGLTGAEAITMRAELDIQVDRTEDFFKRSAKDPELQTLIEQQLSLLRTVLDKIDRAIAFRETEIPVPF